MKNRKAITTYGLAAFATAALLSSHAAATPINYVETFDVLGVQANTDGEAFADYNGWTFNVTNENTSQAFAQVFNTNELALVSGSQHSGVVVATLSANQIAGTPSFDVSTNALTVTADVGDRFPGSGSSGNRAAGINIGDVAIGVTLGRNPTLYRVTNLLRTVQYEAFEDIGFIAPQGQDGDGNTQVTPMSLSVIENGANYDYTVNIGSFTDTFSVAQVDAGSIDHVGVSVQTFSNFSTASAFDNFTVTQIPEPGSMALLGLGTLLIARRRRA